MFRQSFHLPLVLVTLAAFACNPGVQVNDYEGTSVMSGAITTVDDAPTASSVLSAISVRRDLFPRITASTGLKTGRHFTDRTMTVMKLGQTHMGLPVFGHDVVVHMDGKDVVYAIDHTADIGDTGATPSFDALFAKKLVNDFIGLNGTAIMPATLGFTVRNEKVRLVYKVKARTALPGNGGTFEVDAITGTVMKIEPDMVALKTNVTFQDGTTGEVEVSKLNDEYSGTLCDGPYCTVDTTRAPNATYGVSFLRAQYEITKQTEEMPAQWKIFASNDPSDWSGAVPDGLLVRRNEGVSALYTLGKVYDFYSLKHGWKGISGNDSGLDVYLARGGSDPLGLNAYWMLGIFDSMVLLVAQPDDTGTKSASFAMSTDVVGHEFTHGVQLAPLSDGGLCELEYSNDYVYQSASVSEGFCDTMGLLADDDLNPDWKIGIHGVVEWNGTHHWLRNDSDPFDPNAMTWGDKTYNSKASCTQRLCSQFPPPSGHKEDCPTAFGMYDTQYVCATLIPHPAWKMKQQLGTEIVGNIYFHVLDKYMGQKAKLPEVAQFVFDSCNDLYPGDTDKCCVVAQALVDSAFTINLRGLSCSIEPLDGGTVTDGGKKDGGAIHTDGGIDSGKDAGKDAGFKDASADATTPVDTGHSGDASKTDSGLSDAGSLDATVHGDGADDPVTTTGGGCACSTVGL